MQIGVFRNFLAIFTNMNKITQCDLCKCCCCDAFCDQCEKANESLDYELKMIKWKETFYFHLVSNRWYFLRNLKFTKKDYKTIRISFRAHCSKSSFFVQKFNFDFPWKVSIFLVKNSWKCCGFELFRCWQLWFHEKNCQRKI